MIICDMRVFNLLRGLNSWALEAYSVRATGPTPSLEWRFYPPPNFSLPINTLPHPYCHQTVHLSPPPQHFSPPTFSRISPTPRITVSWDAEYKCGGRLELDFKDPVDGFMKFNFVCLHATLYFLHLGLYQVPIPKPLQEVKCKSCLAI